MGNEEGDTNIKPEKASSPAQEPSNIHAYPNWAAVQAYYGPGVNLPPPYFNSAVTSGHPPPHPYMWGTPQHLMPPYGTPYAAMYPPGGVYAHPSFLVPPPQGLGDSSPSAASEAMVVTPLSMATPAKSSSSKDQGFTKKLKRLNGSTTVIGNGNSGSSAASHSGDCGTEGSSGSDDNSIEVVCALSSRVLSQEYNPSVELLELARTGRLMALLHMVEMLMQHPVLALGVSPVPASLACKQVETVPYSNGNARGVSVTPPAVVAEVPSQHGLASGQLTTEERELKREKRKQSNRESARRSRLRKQAEAEELAVKVDSLNAENLALRSEINQLTENSEKLRLENSSLMEKLKSGQHEGAGEMVSNNMLPQEGQPVSTENFLSKVENSLSNTTKGIETNDNPNSGSKLRQLLESSPRGDAVAAS
ncbi:hypothetical protein IFM89_038506 [Coptis chinensis]|uniref:BZIP domain-containing protein n=1 Tax=Coptis chinensis TaxID=261450 RepID=A0A835IID7_9MAGN|nr:hypothetical protein IFM89_038506 [Coptis chinensis]